MQQLASSTNSETWIHNEGWLEGSVSVCDWDLVGCDGSGRVKILALSFNNLTGSLPPEVSMLAALQDLDLEYNAISGPIPSSIGRLKVKQLGLGGNNFTLAPAELCDLPATAGTACDLSGNAFSCDLPTQCDLATTCGATCN
ncbi:hypothetical protein TeGR_g3398 [Tetraparma gracilis]|uniref:Uncharacterized protein n=1 Tax=Tetraparma gracilis TaxID=2962635 RepID=A0ABQ6MIK4_9STRA|nr:hypothetical protein TeGR_g3398 [Tetraparma gracilis]